jgi:hypothetical protein
VYLHKARVTLRHAVSLGRMQAASRVHLEKQMDMLACEPLCLSTQFVIFLSVKSMLLHVGLKLFLLNSAWFLSVKTGFVIAWFSGVLWLWSGERCVV